ncbi:MAG: glutathione S-transferase family protein [bacterium]
MYLHHLSALKGAFDDLERRLGDGRPFLVGPALTMADVIWSMKLMRLDECGYPFAELHPALLRWFRRVSGRRAFQEGVMARHRFWHGLFLAKSRAENLMGIGLRQAAVAAPAKAPAP